MSIVRIDSFARMNTNPPLPNAEAATFGQAMLLSGYRESYGLLTRSEQLLGPDILDATRPALLFRRAQASSLGSPFRSKISIPVPTEGSFPWVFGVSVVFAPNALSYGTNLPFAIDAGGELTQGVDWNNLLFVVRNTGQIVSDSAGTIQNPSFTVTTGVRHYFEVRYVPQTREVTVYVDDELVLYKTLTFDIPYLVLAGGYYTSGATPPNGTIGLSLADLYLLIEDDIAPNSRLGASTRVVPIRPSGDASPNDFVPPSGVEGNYEIAAKRMIEGASPPVLSAGALPATDMYDTTIPETAAGASAVHAVALRSVAFNVDTSEHDIAMKVRQGESGTLETFGTPTPVAPGSGLVYSDQISAINPSTGLAWTATDLASLDIGVTVED